VLADSEVDSRFRMLVASLNSTVEAVDWPEMGEPAEDFPEAERWPRPRAKEGIRALRVSAVVVAVVTMAAGVVVSRILGAGILVLIAWMAIIVPAVTFAAIFAIDRVRAHNAEVQPGSVRSANSIGLT
jgi:hypothetical protein